MTKPEEKKATAQPKRTLDELKQDASTQLKKILLQGKNIKKFQSNADLVLKRYHTDNSFLDNLATGYGNLSWWIKLGLMASAVSIGACIGIVCNLMVVLSVITFVLYASIALILENHHASLVKKDERFTADIAEMEESLAESVQHIDEIEQSLSSVFTSLCEMNTQQAEDIASFEIQIDQLEKQVTQLISINEQLSATKNTLAKNTEAMGRAFNTIKVSCTQLTEDLSEEIDELIDTDEALRQHTSSVLDDHKHLNQVNVALRKNHTDLEALTGHLTTLVEELKIQAQMSEAFTEISREKLSASIDATLSVTHNTDEIIHHADGIIDDALQALEGYQADKTKSEQQRVQREAEFNYRKNSTSALLNRVNDLLANQSRPKRQNPIAAYVPLMQ